jgi:uncharacterized membrane protein
MVLDYILNNMYVFVGLAYLILALVHFYQLIGEKGNVEEEERKHKKIEVIIMLCYLAISLMYIFRWYIPMLHE